MRICKASFPDGVTLFEKRGSSRTSPKAAAPLMLNLELERMAGHIQPCDRLLFPICGRGV
jgi:hypothetical protein